MWPLMSAGVHCTTAMKSVGLSHFCSPSVLRLLALRCRLSHAYISTSHLWMSAFLVTAMLVVVECHCTPFDAQGWRSDRLRHFPELKFCYEEEAAPEEFFVPYIW